MKSPSRQTTATVQSVGASPAHKANEIVALFGFNSNRNLMTGCDNGAGSLAGVGGGSAAAPAWQLSAIAIVVLLAIDDFAFVMVGVVDMAELAAAHVAVAHREVGRPVEMNRLPDSCGG
jgi:hypothetical protein